MVRPIPHMLRTSETESRPYKLFVKSINSPKTFEQYNRFLNRFCDYTSLTYDEIINLDTEELQTKLEDWVLSLTETGVRGSTILTVLAGVEHFLDINRKSYFRKPLHRLVKKDKDVGGGILPFTNDDIKQMLESTTKLRTKALLLFFASTGIRPGAFEDPVLRVKHLTVIYDENGKDTGCYSVHVYESSKEQYWAFLTPEARKTLDRYHGGRKLSGERFTPETPLFASDHLIENPHLTVDAVYRILSDLYKHAKILRGKIGNRYDKAMVYAFRKRFNTILKMHNSVNSNIAEKLMAHKKGLDGRYFTPTMQECFAEFRKAIPELTVSDEERLKIQNQAKDEILKKQNENDSIIKEHEEKLDTAVKMIDFIFEEFPDLKSKLLSKLSRPIL